jgi:hypothetical protein
MYEVKIKQTTDRPSDQARQSIEAWYLSVDVIGHPLERQSQLVLARQESSWSCSE